MRHVVEDRVYVGEGDSGGVGGEVVLVVVAWRGGREAVLCVVHNAGRDHVRVYVA